MGGDGVATPAQLAQWEAEPLPPAESFSDKFKALVGYFGRGYKSFIFGSYSYGYLCLPNPWPWRKGGNAVSPNSYSFL